MSASEMVRLVAKMVKAVSSGVLKGTCAVITGASFKFVTVTLRLNTALLAVPSLTVTGTVNVPLKFKAGVIVLPTRV